MPVSTERFIECLAETGIVSKAEADALAGALSASDRAADADTFARELVRQGTLTRYQAAAIYQGKSEGLLLGNYLILDRLGSGGMGQVFRARHRRMDRIVALKMLSKRALDTPEAVARFLREVKTTAQLVHPNIVTAYDADEVGGLHFLVMECVDGTDLAALVKSKGPLPVPQAVDYLSQAAVGLEHAHRQGIVHRDIKPSNLLVDRSGTVKILDMGLARRDDPLAASGAEADADLTAGGSIMGTIDFMAPEQAMDSRQVDARADIYSLGCTLHYLLTGRPPFTGDTVMQRLTAHQRAPIPQLSASRPEVPSGLQAVFVRMMAKQPQDRFGSMREVIDALKTSQAPAAPVAVQAAPRVVPQAAVAVAPLPIPAVQIAPPSLALDAMASIVLPGDRRPRRRRKSQLPLMATLSMLLLGGVAVGLWIMSPHDKTRVTQPSGQKKQAPKATASAPANHPLQSSGAPSASVASSLPEESKTPQVDQPAETGNDSATKQETTPTLPKPEVVIDPTPATKKGPKKTGKQAAATNSVESSEPARPLRHPIPTSEAQASARQLFYEVYKADIAQAKAPEAKPALAKKLLRDIDKERDDVPVQYILLRAAADLAVDAGDVDLTAETLKTLSTQFVVDYPAEYSAALLKMSLKPHSLALESRLVEAGVSQVDAALELENFDAASTAAEAADAAARKMKDTSLLKQMIDLEKTINAARLQWEAQQSALAVLKRSPDDAAANLQVGRYEAFVQGKWPQAFTHLAKGGSGTLAALAAKSLAPGNESTALADLGDLWWKAGEDAKGKDRAEFRAAATYWYQQALPGLSGLKKEGVLNHLSDAGDRTAVKGAILVFTFEPNCFFTSGSSRYLLDLSGLGNHAEVKKAESVPGKVGSGLSFGVGLGYVECSKSEAFHEPPALSICAWIKPRSWKKSPVDYIVSKDDWADGGTHGFVLRGGSDGDINFTFGNGDWRNTTSKRHLEADVWHHVASVYDGRRTTIFLDGVPDTTKETPFKISPSHFPLRIGRGGFDAGRYFDGVIDELAIFNRPLTELEVRNIYRLGLTGKPLAR